MGRIGNKKKLGGKSRLMNASAPTISEKLEEGERKLK